MNTYFDDYDYCWMTDDHQDLCCELCPHKNSCNRYTGDRGEEEDDK